MVGENVRRLREDRGWSQQNLAERIGVTQGAVSQIERGIAGPLVQTMQRIAEAFGVPVATLLIPQQELQYRPPIRIQDSSNDSSMKQKQVSPESNNIP